jgi:hypothetical protein
MRRRALVVGAAAAVVLAGGGLAAATSAPHLRAEGPVRLDGTTASASFEIGDRTIRHFRYADRRELGYTLVLENEGALAVRVVGVGTAGPAATLLGVDRLQMAGTSRTEFTVPAGDEVAVRLVLDMRNCERVSSRAGSFLDRVAVRTEVGGVLEQTRVVTLPEELHTGSPREALCPRATSKSRSPG